MRCFSLPFQNQGAEGKVTEAVAGTVPIKVGGIWHAALGTKKSWANPAKVTISVWTAKHMHEVAFADQQQNKWRLS